MKIVVDSNIIFSAILNTESNIGQLIINGSKFFDFYTVGLLKEEILDHQAKILKIANFTEGQFFEIYQLFVGRLMFVDDVLITDNNLHKAINLVSDIDPDDSLFVALSNQLNANLWTGDKRLINELKKKGYSRVLSTDELYLIYLDKQLKFSQKRRK